MSEPMITIKIWTKTRRSLRMLAATTGERMVEAVDRLVADELRRVGQTVPPAPDQRPASGE